MPDSRRHRPKFISHVSANLAVAKQIERSLAATGLDPWLDDSDIRIGVLLGKEAQQAIRQSAARKSSWSGLASESRWLAAEIGRTSRQTASDV